MAGEGCKPGRLRLANLAKLPHYSKVPGPGEVPVMKFSPQFLDTLRDRIRLSDVVGRHVALTRKGKELIGLCPFHADTDPSFRVVDEKNFYHCFPCGANGDAIDFVVKVEGLGFVEAVEQLAAEAGLEIPRPDPEDQRRWERRATLHEVMEAATVVFENRLRSPEGAAARSYLEGRGLDEDTIRQFRLGYAGSGRTQLRSALTAKGIEPALLFEAGLVRRPDDGRDPYEVFRERVIFPITDRRGRVIAFGGRTLTDRMPKYLNSPDTPLFSKGRVLYGLSQARQSATRDGEIVVVEGYMDVIALARGGMPNAVAPLGTALTEDQIVELWRLAPEPVLCLDGDAAGRRAAGHAATRVLPLLKPGHSLRFVTLPEGQDPDDLLREAGPEAVRRLLSGSRSLSDFLWDFEQQARPIDTPERYADFVDRLRARVRQIADATVQQAYRDSFERRLAERRGERRGPRSGRGWQAWRPSPPGSEAARTRLSPALAEKQQQRAVLAAIAVHPGLLDEFGEALGRTGFRDSDLDRLRRAILEAYHDLPGLETATLDLHLSGLGFGEGCGGLLQPATLRHASFARPGETIERARTGVRELLARLHRYQLEVELAEAKRAFAEDNSEGAWERVNGLRELLQSVNAGSGSLEDVPEREDEDHGEAGTGTI